MDKNFFFSCSLVLLQVLAYAQQSRERANKEQASLVERMHEYKKQIDREIRLSNGLTDAHNGDGIQTIARSSHKMIEAVMQSASKGKVPLPGSLGIKASCRHSSTFIPETKYMFRSRPFVKVTSRKDLQT